MNDLVNPNNQSPQDGSGESFIKIEKSIHWSLFELMKFVGVDLNKIKKISKINLTV